LATHSARSSHPSSTALLAPPTLAGLTPATVATPTNVQVTVTGTDFAATPTLDLVNGSFLYPLTGVTFVEPAELQRWLLSIQVAPGTYDRLLTNPDGQSDTLPKPFTVLP
jgi:hypothetical protein